MTVCAWFTFGFNEQHLYINFALHWLSCICLSVSRKCFLVFCYCLILMFLTSVSHMIRLQYICSTYFFPYPCLQVRAFTLLMDVGAANALQERYGAAVQQSFHCLILQCHKCWIKVLLIKVLFLRWHSHLRKQQSSGQRKLCRTHRVFCIKM